jgi:N-acetylmuramoyl-L-alanine amidase
MLALAAACGGGTGGLTASPAVTAGRATTTEPGPTVPAATVPPSGGPATTTAPPGPGVVLTAAGVVLPVLSGAPGRWRVRTPCGADDTVTAGTPVSGTVIVIDPGHGGHERGAVAPGGLAEATVNLAVARRVREALEASGVRAVLTRDGDYDLSLSTRALIATDLTPRALVSVHHNAVPDGPRAGPGTETYFQIGSADSRRLAGLIYEEVTGVLSAYRVAWVGDTDAGAKYRPGSRGDYYAILRQPAPVTSVLAELAYISNPPEAELLARPDVQAVEGDAVARGILRWLRSADPGSGFTVPYPRVDPPAPPGPPAPCVDPSL